MTSPVIPVPSLADRQGNLTDIASSLNGTVDSTGRAAYLDSEFGYAPNTVFVGEPYYTPGCTTTAQCVLPNATIPVNAWSTPAKNLLQYIPTPSNTANNTFSTSAFSQTVRDDKGSARFDANTRWGQIYGYYFIDNYRVDNPYPGGQGGASVPGFNALTIGRAQVFTLGDTKVIGMNTVDEFHIGIIRNSNIIGQPRGGLGVSLASQGFVTGPHSTGIDVQAPQYEGVMNLVFPSFVMGVPVTNTNQWNNTLYGSDTLSKVIGNHSIKFGGEFHIDQVNEHPNATFNGTFNFANQNSETGSAFANFLLGVPSQYTQSTGQPFYLRNRYAGAFIEDSWRMRPGLTLNYGVRWDLIRPWSEKYNNIQTVVPGRQSVLYPNAIPGLLVPGDPGIPSTLSPTKYDKFAPRIGLAYAPKYDHGILRAIFGKDGDSSIRASFGMFYTAFQGLSAGVMYSVPPFGYNYLSPHEVVHHRFGKEPLLPVGRHGDVVLPLRQLPAFHPVDQRKVAEPGERVTKRFIKEELLRRVVQVVIAAKDVGDPHLRRRRSRRRSCTSGTRRCAGTPGRPVPRSRRPRRPGASRATTVCPVCGALKRRTKGFPSVAPGARSRHRPYVPGLPLPRGHLLAPRVEFLLGADAPVRLPLPE